MSGGALEVGVTVGGRWRIDRFIASGGFGRVYAASDTSSADVGSVAVKVLLEGASTAERQAFLAEVRHMAALRHPNLVTHIDSGLVEAHEQGAVFLVTELCEESLAEHVAARPGGVLPEAELPALLSDLAAGLDHLHRSGRVHRDLKPANILRSGSTWKLADFGLVRDLSASGVYHVNTVAGTPRFMAPEFFGGGPIGPATDIWSIGIIVHELVAGVGVHQGEGPAFVHNLTSTAPVIAPTLSPRTADLVRRCLAMAPEQRPTAAALPAIGAGTAPAAPASTQPSFDPAVTGAIPPAALAGAAAAPGAAPTPTPGWAPPTGSLPAGAAAQPVAGGPPGSGGSGGGRRWIFAGVLGFAAVAALAIAGALIAGGGGADATGDAEAAEVVDADPDAETPPADADGSEPGSDTDADPDPDADPAAAPSDDARSIGDDVELDEFIVGDCVDPDIIGDRFVLRTLRACDAPHFYEILALLEPPDAGGAYPGDEPLFTYGSVQCRQAFESRFGIDEVDTALQVVAFRPSEEDWDNDIFNVVCAVNRGDNQPIDSALGDDVSAWIWASGDSLSLLEIQLMRCFDTPNALVDAGVTQRIIYRDCDEPHDGEHYWNVLVNDLQGDSPGSYPGESVLASESSTRCHDILHEDYGEDHNAAGFTSTAIYPTEREWDLFGAVIAACLVVFDEPLDTPLTSIVDN